MFFFPISCVYLCYLSYLLSSFFSLSAFMSFSSHSDDASGLIRGRTEFGAKYNNTLYLMSSLSALYKFLRTPWTYASVQLPKRLPPPEQPISLSDLSPHGYLEQSLGKNVCFCFSFSTY